MSTAEHTAEALNNSIKKSMYKKIQGIFRLLSGHVVCTNMYDNPMTEVTWFKKRQLNSLLKPLCQLLN